MLEKLVQACQNQYFRWKLNKNALLTKFNTTFSDATFVWKVTKQCMFLFADRLLLLCWRAQWLSFVWRMGVFVRPILAKYHSQVHMFRHFAYFFRWEIRTFVSEISDMCAIQCRYGAKEANWPNPPFGHFYWRTQIPNALSPPGPHLVSWMGWR